VRSFTKGRKQTKSEETQMKVQEMEVENSPGNVFGIIDPGHQMKVSKNYD
jgi:hypothetical protein